MKKTESAAYSALLLLESTTTLDRNDFMHVQVSKVPFLIYVYFLLSEFDSLALATSLASTLCHTCCLQGVMPRSLV